MEKLLFKTTEFEGPLDLMLHLISRHKLDIYDIQISELLEQYMVYMQDIQHENLETASEFLEMASRLVHIKTVMLLPRHEEEGERLRTELQGQLLEYQVCKLVAQRLGEQSKLHLTFVRNPQKIEMDYTYRREHPPSDIYHAYQDAVGKGRRRLPPPVQAFSGIVARRMVSVGSRIVYILKSLYKTGHSSYRSLFEKSADRSELVATFLAVLELVKAKRITVDGDAVCFERASKAHHQNPGDAT